MFEDVKVLLNDYWNQTKQDLVLGSGAGRQNELLFGPPDNQRSIDVENHNE